MYSYSIGLVCGGLMEDPDWHIENVNNVTADNLNKAKDIWASITGEDKKSTWSPENKTVWGWQLKVLNTNDPNVSADDYYKE